MTFAAAKIQRMIDNKVVKGKVGRVFFSYALPAVAGLVAVTSAGIVDGMFIGRYLGETALAAVTLSTPIFPAMFGIAILFSTGGEVFSGKFLGEGKPKMASDVFTKAVSAIFLLTTVLSFIGLLNLHSLAGFLGAGVDTHAMVVDYLQVLMLAGPLMSIYSLTHFIRVDGRPQRGALALLLTAVSNIALDYLFIVELNWGIRGAALGTALSYSFMPLVLLPHFLLKKGQLYFVKPTKSLKILREIAYNGSSEFLSEISGGILVFIINLTMMKYYGTRGVAAYAVAGYLLYFVSMINYGLSDSSKSIISVHFGARLFARIRKFLGASLLTSFSVGAIVLILIAWNAPAFVSLFLKDQADPAVISLSIEFIRTLSPMFLLLGLNIQLSAYFTAIHLPMPSLIISSLRTLVLPLILITLLSALWGGSGVIKALISTEVLTLAVAILLLKFYKRKSQHKKGILLSS